jgi:sugar lactone lactonase YvrE
MPQLLTVMTGIAFGESPRWHDGRLWFSDWGAHQVIAVDPGGHPEVVVSVPSFPLCIDFLPDGRLLLVSSDTRQLLCREPDGSLAVRAELGPILDQPWNDITVTDTGGVYVNSIGFEFPGGQYAPGIIALVTPDGRARQVADGLAFPNGMVLTPDGSTLIVAESYAGQLTAFDVTDTGDLTNRRVWADLGDAAPDGICLDAEGAVWYADVPHKCCVRVAEGGAVLATITLDRGCFACALGGPDGTTLFMVATEWKGSAGLGEQARTGQILSTTAPAPAAARRQF